MNIKNLLTPSRKDKDHKQILENVFTSACIPAKICQINIGPTFTQYVIQVNGAVKTKDILQLKDKIVLETDSPDKTIRIQCPVPNTNYIGIEIPNKVREVIDFENNYEVIKTLGTTSKLNIPIGVDVKGEIFKYDIVYMPHMLIAGSSGSGKWNFLDQIILSLLATKSPDELRFVFVDTHRVQLAKYNSIPYLASPIITDAEQGVKALVWLTEEMERRYKLLEQNRTRNVAMFNEQVGYTAIPAIIFMVGEFMELMLCNPTVVEKCVIRVAQLAKAVDIHMILPTSRPDKRFITGLIKANIPTRVAFSVVTGEDSKVILDVEGAENLLGKGDMLFEPPTEAKPIRLQGIYVSEETVSKVVKQCKNPKREWFLY